jgi:hypothetical protein
VVLRLARRAVSFELGMWRSLYRWISRRPLVPDPGAKAFSYAGSGLILHLGVLSKTNVDVVLRHPTTVPLPKGSSEPVTELTFYADDPGSLVAGALEHLATHLSIVDRNGEEGDSAP